MKEFVFQITDLTKIFWLGSLSFVVAMMWTPLLTNILYKFKLGKKIRTEGIGSKAPIFAKLHAKKENTPTLGGVLIWITVLVLTLLFNLNRGETWLPLFALVAAGIIGALDDLLNIFGIGPNRGGLRFRHKLIYYLIIALIGAWWFYYKLEWNAIAIPWVGSVTIGWWYIPLFVVVLIGTSFSVNETDGLDGLAGGLLVAAFGAYAMISFSQGKLDLAAFCATISGALLAFLWFNIYPARFIMGDTGSMSLGITLAVVAFLTNTVYILPIIGIVFVLETLSVIIQITSKKFRGKKVFLSAPVHHHFEALGWPETKVTMRFWIIGIVATLVGLVVVLIS